MTFNYSKLRGRIREMGETQGTIAAASGMRETTYSQKINNNSEFKQSEIIDICRALSIPFDQIHSYFFYPRSSEKLNKCWESQ